MEEKVGFRFHPTDDEVINHFLQNKNAGRDSLVDYAMTEVNMCAYDPWELPQQAKIVSKKDRVWYFFFRPALKYSKSQRTNRATKSGFWKPTGVDRVIKENDKEIGIKKTLVFYDGVQRRRERTNWVMHEYRALSGPPMAGAYVVCKLKYKKGKLPQDMKQKNLYEPPGEKPSDMNDKNLYQQQEEKLLDTVDKDRVLLEQDKDRNRSHPGTSEIQETSANCLLDYDELGLVLPPLQDLNGFNSNYDTPQIWDIGESCCAEASKACVEQMIPPMQSAAEPSINCNQLVSLSWSEMSMQLPTTQVSESSGSVNLAMEYQEFVDGLKFNQNLAMQLLAD